MAKKNQPDSGSFLGLLWRRNRYFLAVWIVLTAIVLIAYRTQFDRERICTYQYCPSSFVLAACVGCLVLGMVWVDFFFWCVRPFLQWNVGKLLGARVTSDLKQKPSFVELLFTEGQKDFWTVSRNTSISKRIAVSVLDLLSFLLFLMLPIAALISAASGIAYIEQQRAPTPPGLIQLQEK